ncbi:receptor-like protein EIX2 [Malania oleifera]|uniref:receptor-like protein EIX2 n=1 Tax=Malania oleifera TaxID=397392 RepID=UPI0025ADF7E4|nr:receptor-like protein EIX2 [Malania oleifera]
MDGRSLIQLLHISIGLLPFAFNSEALGNERERQALLQFKQELTDNYGLLSSWGTDEANRSHCNWKGVYCSNQTGTVIKLQLAAPFVPGLGYQSLKGKISPSLLELQCLNHLDLSHNFFNFTPIPDFIGSLSNLTYLNLSFACLSGPIPHELGNLSSLLYLDLSWNSYKNVGNLEWLSHLTLLRHLDLSGVNLSEATHWQQTITKLPMLTELHLRQCNLPQTVLDSLNSSASLSVLDLYGNHLNSSIYQWLFNFSACLFDLNLSLNHLQGPIPEAFGSMFSLARIDLSFNQLQGQVPKSLGNLCGLKLLDLSWNNFSGELPELVKMLAGCTMNSLEFLDLSLNKLSGSFPDVTTFSSLRELHLYANRLNGSFPISFERSSTIQVLDLSENQIMGTLPDLTVFSLLRELYLNDNELKGPITKSIGHLHELEVLDVSSNSLEGAVSEAHLSNLSKLQILDLSFNSLILEFSSEWVPPFQLDIIRLASCRLGPHFPKWLQTQSNFFLLDISASGIEDTVPTWFWDLSPRLLYLNLSCNQISGTIPDLSLKFTAFPAIDFSSNHFNGSIPLFSPNLSSLILSKNMFSGSLLFLCGINGKVFNYLDLSYNQLSGELPDCWMQFGSLIILNLANNNLVGTIPSSMSFLLSIKSLHLQSNKLTGELPSSLKNCRDLLIVNMEGNRFSGTIPTWIGESLQKLSILSLRSNEFYGSIPLQLCRLEGLQFLDLSLNNISGAIPKCLDKLSAMNGKGSSAGVKISLTYSSYNSLTNGHITSSAAAFYVESATLVWKGRDVEYNSTLGLVKIIDFSGNKLSGEIPEEVMNLVGLVALNLSRNNLIGLISPKIGQLRKLESLDLSRNQLSGKIPTSLSDLTYLSHLDLSNNNLWGKIPLGIQLQSFEASVYMGNPKLCGSPLPNQCSDEESAEHRSETNEKRDNDLQEEHRIFMHSTGLGFILGLSGLCGSLSLNRSWRLSYFQFVSSMGDWLYPKISVLIAKLQRRIQS